MTAKRVKKSAGAQKGNRNARKHGAYSGFTQLDQRTKDAKIIQQIQSELVSALGGDPSPQEIMLIQRASMKALRCSLIEVAMLKDGNPSRELERSYLRWSREMREDLKAIGLQRREKQIAADLIQYIQKNY